MTPFNQDNIDEGASLLLENRNANNNRVNMPHEKHRSLWSILVFHWFHPILHTAHVEKRLNPDDLDLVPLPHNCSTEYLHHQFQYYWKDEISKNPKNPSLIRALYRSFGKQFVYAGFLKFVCDIFRFVGPQILREMIIYLGEESSGTTKTIKRGLMLTSVVIVSQIVVSLCRSHYYFQCDCVGLRMRNALIVAIYQKAVLLSSAERQNRSTGEITNLVSIDAERFLEWIMYIHNIWSCPLQVVITLFFLWKDLGPSSLGALIVVVLMIPISKGISNWLGSAQQELMEAVDKRVDVTSEILSNIKILKLQVWEVCYQKRLLSLREIELKKLYRYFLGDAVSDGIWVLAPIVVSLCTFTPYVLTGHKLNVASALTALALFDLIQTPLAMLPRTISGIVETKISIDRLRSFLCCQEYEPINEGTLQHNGVDLSHVTAGYSKKQRTTGSDDDDDDDSADIVQRNANSDEEQQNREAGEDDEHTTLLDGVAPGEHVIALKNISLQCQPGDFIAVVGSVGSGKSSLINAILGEMTLLSGQAQAKGKLAYFSQNPFILNATLRDNILFGHVNDRVDEDLYQRCLECCALTHDIALLSNGDKTEIGERGVTLSGGQKARVALARTVYHRGDVTIIDDALSAVDMLVAKHLLEYAIVGELLTQDRSVIFVTNTLQLLNHPRVNQILVVKDGTIVERGTYTELTENADSNFFQMMSTMETTISQHESSSDMVSDTNSLSMGSFEVKSNSLALSSPTGDPGLMSEEIREEGHVGADVYWTWIHAAGGVFFLGVVFMLFFLFESISVLSNWWLTYWSVHGNAVMSQPHFLAVYAIINVFAALLDFLRAFSVGYFTIHAAKKLFRDMLQGVLHAKMSFYDTTPIGRLVNRFSEDIYCIDGELRGNVTDYLVTIFQVLGTIVVIAAVNPLFTICILPLIALYISEQSVFTASYREIRRLVSVSGSPVYALLGESIDGAAVIRAYSAQDRLFERMIEALDKQQHAQFLQFVGEAWLTIRLEFIGTLIIAFTCLTTVIQHVIYENNQSYVGLAGLAISYALSVTQSLQWSVHMATEVEANFVSVERVKEYISLENEGIREMPSDEEIERTWPSHGEIEFQNVHMRYRPELPLVLKGLNIHIPAGSKVGVAGRTGAGKSSLMVALLRIVELTDGKILIDKTDIRTLGLSTLRQNIAVIPQEPVLFSGTIRSNLDPFDEYTDETLYESLQQVGLFNPTAINSSSGSLKSLSNVRVRSLDDLVSEGGANFSNGQRQLIVIARALLKGQKVVISDEATASIDSETDDAIQKVLRTKFVNATCITIAHRLNTIMDSDYILVMHEGKAAEFDTPKNLLDKGGLFRELVNALSD